MNSFEKPHNLSQEIDAEVEKISFGNDYKIIRVNNPEKYAAVIDAGLGMDYRAKNEGGEKFTSVFEGLDFDVNRIRTQSYYLKDKEKNAAVMTFAIMPKKWVSEEKYFRRTDNGVEICDFKTISKEDPDFVIAPAWTKVNPAYLTKFAIPGFRLFKNVLQTIEKNSPQNTWVEVAVQGTYKQKEGLFKLANEKGVGAFIPKEELPFKLEDIGVSSKGAESTSKMAQLIGIPQLPDIGGLTLGPVYAKKAKI